MRTYEGVDSLEASLHRLVHGFSGDDAWGLNFNSCALISLNGTLAINGGTEGIDDATDDALTNRDIDDRAGSLHNITLLNFSILTEDDDTDVVRLQVKGHTLDTGGELHHLTSLDLGETEHTGDTITDGDNGSELFQVILPNTKNA